MVKLGTGGGQGSEPLRCPCPLPPLWPWSGAVTMSVLAQEAREEMQRREITTRSLSFLIGNADGTLAVLGTLARNPVPAGATPTARLHGKGLTHAAPG